MDVQTNRKVVGERRAPCAGDPTIEHVTGVRLADDTRLEGDDLPPGVSL